MNKLFSLALVSFFGVSSFAETFSCRMDADNSVLLAGSFTQEKAVVKITDQKNVLEIQELELNESISMTRRLRKKEDKYSFAKYYVDFNAWQDIEISVPKNISGKYFKAFLTVYQDDGDRMAPGDSNKLTCLSL